MKDFLDAASKINSQWSIAAFTIAAILFILTQVVLKPSKTIRNFALLVSIFITVIGILPILASTYIKSLHEHGIYRVRITVLDDQNVPTENAKVWSTFGGEAKKVSGGWEIDIPSVTIPTE